MALHLLFVTPIPYHHSVAKIPPPCLLELLVSHQHNSISSPLFWKFRHFFSDWYSFPQKSHFLSHPSCLFWDAGKYLPSHWCIQSLDSLSLLEISKACFPIRSHCPLLFCLSSFRDSWITALFQNILETYTLTISKPNSLYPSLLFFSHKVLFLNLIFLLVVQ